tara:strand:+ start:10365 stop:11234 length:870 start_codon:yes stop_codon:yes gene_type:complete
MFLRIVKVFFCLCFAFQLTAAELQTFHDVSFVPTDWADGDSFRIRFPDGTEQTIRLYGADCIEWHIGDESDARRLRAQRRYFGISDYGDGYAASIELAKEQAASAYAFIVEELSEPFTVYTSFADGRGDGRYSRVYAFVETSQGRDLATELVQQGYARAFGVYRSTIDGLSRSDYMDQLKDAELVAARRGQGVWNYTDWDRLPEERSAQRSEDAETAAALGIAPPTEPLDVNTASRDTLQSVPGIGEVTANRIIESRPFQTLGQLKSVHGIGPATFEKISPYFKDPSTR